MWARGCLSHVSGVYVLARVAPLCTMPAFHFISINQGIHYTVVQLFMTWPQSHRCFSSFLLSTSISRQITLHLAADEASPLPSGTVTTPRLRAAPTVRWVLLPIPWTHMHQGCTRACRTHTLIPTHTFILTHTLTHQRAGHTPRPRPTGPTGLSTNCTHRRLWIPTMGHCSCPQ